MDGWPRRRSYLRHLWSSVWVSRRPFLVYFGAKTTQRAVPTKTCEIGKGRRTSVSQSVRNETPSSESDNSSPGNWTVKSEAGRLAVKTMARWVSIFGSCVGFSQFSRWPYEQTSSSSSCRAASTDIPDPLTSLLPIVHRLRQVFRATSYILT